MSNAIKKERLEVPIWHKPFLTIEEATAYTGIGRDTLREMTRFADCPFVLWVGHRRMIKRELFDEYMTLSDELAMELEEYMPEDIIINARAYKWDNSDNTIKLVLAMAHLELGELKLSDITRRLLTQVD